MKTLNQNCQSMQSMICGFHFTSSGVNDYQNGIYRANIGELVAKIDI